jgi:hypothetical protein
VRRDKLKFSFVKYEFSLKSLKDEDIKEWGVRIRVSEGSKGI